MKDIKFAYKFHKLAGREFTTVRGVGTGKIFKEGEIVSIVLRGRELCKAMVVLIEFKKLIQIPLEVMKADGEFPGFAIRTRADFFGLLNSLRTPPKPKLKDYEEQVSVIHLRRF